MTVEDKFNIKTLIIGAVIAAGFIVLGHMYLDWFYPLSAIGLLYAGYGQSNIKKGAIFGALASTPIIVLAFIGFLGTSEGFFLTGTGMIVLGIMILLVGAVVGFIGAYAKINRLKAIEEYEKKQQIGKNKNKKKNKK